MIKDKISNSTFLFNIAYIMWITLYIIKQTYFTDILPIEYISPICRLIIYCLLFRKFLLDEFISIKSLEHSICKKNIFEYILKKYILVFILMVIVLFVTINSRIINIMDTFLFIYSARNIDIKKIIKITLNINIVIMICTVSTSLMGLIKNEIWYRNDYSLRYGLGYKYTTFIANYFFHMVLMYIYLKEEKKLIITECIVLMLINSLIYYLTDTRTTFYLVTIIIIAAYFIKINKNNRLDNSIIKRNIIQYIFPILAIITFIITISYDGSNSLLRFIDNLLTGRLALGKNAINKYGLSLFGQRIIWINGGNGLGVNGLYDYVDSSYINILLNFGLFTLVLVCIGFIKVCKNALINNDKYLCIALIALAIHSVIDPQLIELGYNPFLLMISIWFIKDKEIKV